MFVSYIFKVIGPEMFHLLSLIIIPVVIAPGP